MGVVSVLMTVAAWLVPVLVVAALVHVLTDIRLDVVTAASPASAAAASPVSAAAPSTAAGDRA